MTKETIETPAESDWGKVFAKTRYLSLTFAAMLVVYSVWMLSMDRTIFALVGGFSAGAFWLHWAIMYYGEKWTSEKTGEMA